MRAAGTLDGSERAIGSAFGTRALRFGHFLRRPNKTVSRLL